VTFTREPESWRIRSTGSDRVDLGFEPRAGRKLRLEAGLVGVRLDWAAGCFSGSVRGDDGEHVRLDGLAGWAEAFDARW
jgi:hypothetical protein